MPNPLFRQSRGGWHYADRTGHTDHRSTGNADLHGSGL